MEIDRNAAMVTQAEVFIAAPAATLWNTMADIDRWSEWQPGVAFAKLEGKLAPGSVFRWKSGGVTIVSTLQEVEPGRRISWTGDATGIKAIHIWTFTAQGNGTQVITEESWSGWVSRTLKLFSPKMLEKSLAETLRIFKAYAERQ